MSCSTFSCKPPRRIRCHIISMKMMVKAKSAKKKAKMLLAKPKKKLKAKKVHARAKKVLAKPLKKLKKPKK